MKVWYVVEAGSIEPNPRARAPRKRLKSLMAAKGVDLNPRVPLEAIDDLSVRSSRPYSADILGYVDDAPKALLKLRSPLNCKPYNPTC